MNNINISGIKIFPISNGIGGCIGVAQFILNGVIKLTGVKLFNKNGKFFIVYPRNTSNKYKRSYFYPLNGETAKYITDSIHDAYNNLKVEA